MRNFMNVAKALADENRVRALLVLCDQELCVCQIIELLCLAPSTVSKHMSILKQARLVDSRKDGRWIYYRLADGDVPAEAAEAIAWVKKSLWNDVRIRKDRDCLKKILEVERKVICRQQSPSN